MMAIGFKLSNVLEMELAKDEAHAVDFTTKSIRYRITFDDPDLRKALIKLIEGMQEPQKQKNGEKPDVRFYVDESKLGK